MASKRVVADASFMINLMAHGHAVEVLSALGIHLLVAESTMPEIRYLAGPPDDEGLPTLEAIDLSKLRDKGRVAVHSGSSPELVDAFVRCAQELRDQDAWPVALAATLGMPLATDDARQKNIAQALFPAMELVSTLGSLREAAEVLGLDPATLRRMALDLRSRGGFAPPRSDPNRDWYEALLRAASGS